MEAEHNAKRERDRANEKAEEAKRGIEEALNAARLASMRKEHCGRAEAFIRDAKNLTCEQAKARLTLIEAFNASDSDVPTPQTAKPKLCTQDCGWHQWDCWESCVEPGPVNMDAVSYELNAAAKSAMRCPAEEGMDKTYTVVVTFSPEGKAIQVYVSGPLASNNGVLDCVRSSFKAARIPPFKGEGNVRSKPRTYSLSPT